MIPESDTKIVKLPLAQEERRRRWTKTAFSNLWRYAPSGVFFARAKVLGRPVRKSLKTRSLEIAKARLDALLQKERERLARLAEGDGTFGGLAERWSKSIEADPDLKPRSKSYRVETLKAIRTSWPGLEALDPGKISSGALQDWAAGFRKKYSGSRFNGAVETLRAIFELARESGLVTENPAMAVARTSVPMKAKTLPTAAEFKRLLHALDRLRARRPAAVAVRFLVYSGQRIGAASMVRPQDVDLKKNEIAWPALKYTAAPQRKPMTAELRKLVVRLLKEHPGDDRPLMPIANPRKALAHACREVGIARLTPHDLRHLFATRAIECGIDIKTIASWLDHKDGGALLLKRYAHVRQDHSHRMARKLSFGSRR